MNAGANGIDEPQPVIANGDSETFVAVCGALHGSRSLTVVNAPQLCGFANGARGPFLKFTSRSLNGNCGFP